MEIGIIGTALSLGVGGVLAIIIFFIYRRDKNATESRLSDMIDRDIETREKADRVEDALGATQAAMAEGIVPGGGAMLNYLGVQRTGKETKTGKGVVYRACLEPMKCILQNGGITSFLLDVTSPKNGIDVITGEEVDMIDAGIIDPAKVVKSCIRNSASVAGMILTTECVINNLRS